MITRPPPASASVVIACIASVAGGRAASCAIQVPSLMRVVSPARYASGRQRVGAVRLRGPHRVVAERLGGAHLVDGHREGGGAVQVEPEAELHVRTILCGDGL